MKETEKRVELFTCSKCGAKATPEARVTINLGKRDQRKKDEKHQEIPAMYVYPKKPGSGHKTVCVCHACKKTDLYSLKHSLTRDKRYDDEVAEEREKIGGTEEGTVCARCGRFHGQHKLTPKGFIHLTKIFFAYPATPEEKEDINKDVKVRPICESCRYELINTSKEMGMEEPWFPKLETARDFARKQNVRKERTRREVEELAGLQKSNHRNGNGNGKTKEHRRPQTPKKTAKPVEKDLGFYQPFAELLTGTGGKK